MPLKTNWKVLVDQNTQYIGALVTFDKDGHHVNFESYRRLLHAAWITRNIDPRALTFEQVRSESRNRTDVRLHMPEEAEIGEIGLRVCGAFRYMTSYFNQSTPMDWNSYGYTYDNALSSWMPKRMCLYSKEYMDQEEEGLPKEKCFV